MAPISPDDLFRYASMTKPVTSVAILMLVEGKADRPQRPAGPLSPEFGSLRVQRPDGALVPSGWRRGMCGNGLRGWSPAR